jgi:hypothetical protein
LYLAIPKVITVERVWKIAPGQHADDWDLFRDNGCIGLGWRLPDYSKYNSEKEVLKALNKEYGKGAKGHGAGAAKIIWRFLDEVKPQHIVVANRGYNKVVGIGVITSKYLPPKSHQNPIRKDKTTHRHHVRLVNWLIKKEVDLPGHHFFVQSTLWPLEEAGKVKRIKRAYLTRYPKDSKMKQTLDQLFGSVLGDGGDSSATNENKLVQDLKEIDQEKNTESTTKKALVDARLGQGKFRTKVLQSWGNRCSVTGSRIQAAIRASHIKPWRESSNEERLDHENGLPLIASLDALFDAGLISFDSSGKLIASSKVSTKERNIFGIGETSLRKKPTAEMVKYLAHHRAKHGFKS